MFMPTSSVLTQQQHGVKRVKATQESDTVLQQRKAKEAKRIAEYRSLNDQVLNLVSFARTVVIISLMGPVQEL